MTRNITQSFEVNGNTVEFTTNTLWQYVIEEDGVMTLKTRRAVCLIINNVLVKIESAESFDQGKALLWEYYCDCSHIDPVTLERV